MALVWNEMVKEKELLFSLTANDFEWDYFRGTGAGGQKKNKTSSAVRCRHLASGASGKAEDSRSQKENKKLAFARMAASEAFQKWCKIEACRVTGKLAQIEDWIDREMRVNLKVERKDENGRWVEWNSSDGEVRPE